MSKQILLGWKRYHSKKTNREGIAINLGYYIDGKDGQGLGVVNKLYRGNVEDLPTVNSEIECIYDQYGNVVGFWDDDTEE